MEYKREFFIALFIASSLLCAQLYAERYNLSVIKTAEPVKTITWNKDGSNFGYAERNAIVLRKTDGYSIVQQIDTKKSNINYLGFASSVAGSSSQIASLYSDGTLDFRNLPDEAPVLSLTTEDSEPTVMIYSYDGTYFAVGNQNGTVILYQQDYSTSTATSQQIGNLGVPITSLCFSRDNKYLLIGAADNSVTVIEVASRKIVNGYAYNAKNKVPILMTADSKSIIMTTGDSTVGFFDLQFNRYNYYTTYRDILSMHISADDHFLIILTDDNVFSYYDLQTHELKRYIPAFNDTKIMTYAFDAKCQKLAISHEDGSLYVLDVASVILDMDQTRGDFTVSEQAENLDLPESKPAETPKTEEPKTEEPKKPETKTPATPKKTETPKKAETPKTEAKAPETPKTEEPKKEEPKVEEKKEEPKAEEPAKEEQKEEEKKPEEPEKEEKKDEPKKSLTETLKEIKEFKDIDVQLKFKDGHGLLVNGGFSLLDSPYTFELSLPVGYRNYNLIKPFYFGGTLEPSIGFPSYDFTYSYTIDGNYLASPKLMGLKVCVPFGFCMYPLKNALEVYAEINAGVSLHNLWDGRFGSTFIAGKVYPSFYGSIKVGAAWQIFNLSVCGTYDALLGIKFKVQTGVIINIGGIRRFITFGSMQPYKITITAIDNSKEESADTSKTDSKTDSKADTKVKSTKKTAKKTTSKEK